MKCLPTLLLLFNLELVTIFFVNFLKILEQLTIKGGKKLSSQLELFLERKDRDDILDFIKDDLFRNYENISDKELDFLAQHIYDFAVLKYNKVDKKEIS